MSESTINVKHTHRPRKPLMAQNMRVAICTILWRGVLLGTALFLIIGDDPSRNLRYNAVAYIIAVIWSYYDGLIARRRWPISGIEGLLLYGTIVGFGNLLVLLFGSPIITGAG